MTMTDRILEALEKFEAECKGLGVRKCGGCGDWHRGESCAACDEAEARTRIIMVMVLATVS
jgi:recombinational DNA repair protein RecR